MRLVLGLALSLLLFATNLVIANDHVASSAWRFTDENRPDYLKLWEIGEDLSQVECTAWPDVLYENYASLYPDFRPLMDDPVLREQWRMSLILNNIEENASSNFCFYASLRVHWREATELLGTQEIVSCGVPATSLLPAGRAVADIVDEFLVYGFSGSAVSLVILLVTVPEDDDNVQLNPDVQYLAQLKYDSITPPEGQLREVATPFLAPSAGDLLSAERKAFVEDAFARGDYQAVLDTTKPC